MLMVSNWHPIVKECIYGSVLFNLIFATLAALEEGRDDQTLFGLVLGGLASVSYIYHRKLTDDNSEVRKKIKREDTIV